MNVINILMIDTKIVQNFRGVVQDKHLLTLQEASVLKKKKNGEGRMSFIKRFALLPSLSQIHLT